MVQESEDRLGCGSLLEILHAEIIVVQGLQLRNRQVVIRALVPSEVLMVGGVALEGAWKQRDVP